MALLKDLKVGDCFYPASRTGRSTPIYEVMGHCLFNPKHGSSTRMCKNRQTGENVSKSCRLEVIKTNTE